MSADVLRRAASLMRERAEAATACAPSPWKAHAATNGNPADGPTVMRVSDASGTPVVDAEYDRFGGDMTAHIASWHPAVALAVAAWLTVTAWWIEDEWPDDPAMPMDWEASTGPTAERVKAALAVARAYLGADA